MKIDLARLPVLEMIVGFLLLAIGLTFIGAFAATGGGGGGQAVIEPSPSGHASPTPVGSPTGNTYTLHLGDNKFDTTQFKLAAGASVTFEITNDGKATHDMHIAGPDGAYDTSDDAKSDPDAIRGGKTATLKWTAPGSPGEIKFQCDFHPDQMKGTITVQ